MRHTKLRFLLAVTPLALASVQAHAGNLSSRQDDGTQIYGGELVPACAWPSTVFINDCTGTLIHPEVVLFAAHCIVLPGVDPTEVRFGEEAEQPERVVETVDCASNPDFSLDDGPGDFAYCTLAEPVVDVPIIPPLMGCETDFLDVGSEIVLAGYGFADSMPENGFKRHVTTTVQEFFGDDEIVLGANGMSSCYGDSGGPAFLQMEDGSWRVFGITSRGTGQCGEPAIYGLMHAGAVPWVEEQTGYDVTPCTDADGTWNPGPDCGEFSLDAHLGGGEWANGCAGGEVSGNSDACGDPFDDSGTDTDTDTGTDSGTESDTDTGTGTDTDEVGTDTDIDTDSDVGSDTAGETEGTAGPGTTEDPGGTETGNPTTGSTAGGTETEGGSLSDTAGETGEGTTVITCTCTQADHTPLHNYGLLGLAAVGLLFVRRRR